MLSSILIANRGEIACRVIETAKRLGVRTIAVFSEADRGARHVVLADEAYFIGPSPASESYLNGARIIEVALAAKAQGIHPGYGFLSENPEFAAAVAEAGLTFIGPSPRAIKAMGLKDAAKALMDEAGVPVVPGYHGDNQDPDFLLAEAEKIGFPVLIKAVAGGGGKGMRLVEQSKKFVKGLEAAKREAKSSFGNDHVLIEKFVGRPRHIEVQVFGDSHGNAVHLMERDCSLQRRHQKVVEEAPAPGMSEQMREAIGAAAVRAAKAIDYVGAGTVEFIADSTSGLREDAFYFMEMNTRLQVEHPVTECITGFDLVEWQLRVASGETLPATQQDISIKGHALEVRLYAENPNKKFFPSTGTLHHLTLPASSNHVRVDTGVREGDTVSMFYDPMIAKIISWGEDRAEALRQMDQALRSTAASGPHTNLAFLSNVVTHPAFARGDVETGFIDAHLDALVPKQENFERALFAAALDEMARPGETERETGREVGTGTDQVSPWHARDGWRIAGGARTTLVFEFESEEQPVNVEYVPGCKSSFKIGIGDVKQRIDVSFAENGKIELDGPEGRWMARVDHDGGDRFVSVGMHAYRLTKVDPFDADFTEGEGGDQIKAPMPGKVIALNVQSGDKVKRGDAVAIVEAMKMEHTLNAPRDAVIDQVTASVGDQVEEGRVLIALVTEGDN